MEVLDKQTEEIAARIIAKFDAALLAGDLPEMERVARLAATTPNQPLQRAILRHLEAA